MRIVSFLPSATEIVAAVGAGERLVGRSEECDYPGWVRALPVVMAARTPDTDRASAEIDARVRLARRTGESLYTVDLDRLAALRPDLLITQDLCAVCSVTEEEVRTACRAAGVGPEILTLSPENLGQVWDSVERIGDAAGATAAARALARSLRARVPPSRGEAGPRVLVLEWIDPPIEAGLWTPELIRSAGGTPYSAPGEKAHRLAWPELEADPPDLLIVSPCSFDVRRTLFELGRSPAGERIRRLTPARGSWVADESYFSRPGPRLADGRELIAALLGGSSPASPDRVRTVVPLREPALA